MLVYTSFRETESLKNVVATYAYILLIIRKVYFHIIYTLLVQGIVMTDLILIF